MEKLVNPLRRAVATKRAPPFPRENMPQLVEGHAPSWPSDFFTTAEPLSVPLQRSGPGWVPIGGSTYGLTRFELNMLESQIS